MEKAQKKILLIWPKARTDPDWGGDLGAIAEPLALEYLAAGLLEDDRLVQILDLRLHPDALAETLLTFQPDIVGVTAFSMHVRAGLKVMAEVKQVKPDCMTIVGGHHATILPEDFFEPQVDLVVCGEGVQPLRTILNRFESTGDYSEIQGVWYRNDQNEFTFGGKQEKIALDKLPKPNRTLLSEEDRNSYFIDWMKPVALIRTTVGCPYRCTFCSLWKVMDGRYYKADIDRVIDELKDIKEEFVFLVDDEPFIDKNRMALLAQGIIDANIKKRFFAYCRIDSLIRNKEVLKLWKKAGMERLLVGIDAISKKDLNEYNKRQNIQQIEVGLEIAKEIGIEIFSQFVVNTDYTHKDFKTLIRFIEHHKLDYPTFTVLTPLPGTDLLADDFSNVSEFQPNGRPNWDYFDTQSIVVNTALPKEEFRKQYRGLFKKFSSSYSQFLIHKPITHNKFKRITSI